MKIIPMNKAVDIVRNDRNSFLKEHNGKELSGENLLTALRAVKKVDGKGGIKIKVFGVLTGQIKVKSTIPNKAKLTWAGNEADPSRSTANLQFNLSKVALDEIVSSKVKSEELNG